MPQAQLFVEPVLKRADTKGISKFCCPYCEEWFALTDPTSRSQAWHHLCAKQGNSKVWFLNGHVIAGVGNYISEEKRAGLG